MPLDLADFAARGQIPEPCRFVPTPRQGGLAVRRKRNRSDLGRMPLELADLAARGQIPEPRGFVITPRQRGLAVRRKRNRRSDLLRMPLSSRISRPVARSQSVAVLPLLSESAVLPSGEMATEVTPPECPSSLRISRPVARSQSVTVWISPCWSQLPDSAVLPSGEMATELTEPECPSNLRISRPRGQIPEPERVAVTARQRGLAVRRKRNREVT